MTALVCMSCKPVSSPNLTMTGASSVANGPRTFIVGRSDSIIWGGLRLRREGQEEISRHSVLIQEEGLEWIDAEQLLYSSSISAYSSSSRNGKIIRHRQQYITSMAYSPPGGIARAHSHAHSLAALALNPFSRSCGSAYVVGSPPLSSAGKLMSTVGRITIIHCPVVQPNT